MVPSAQIVPGDLVKLALGAVVAADVTIVDGSVLVDQSMLTGESEPAEVGVGDATYAGALVRRGEATAQVSETGVRTKFGNTAALVLSAHVVSSQQKVVLRIVRNLVLFNCAVIVFLVAYANVRGLAWSAIIALALTAVLASIPVALPATFTLATALGARVLAKLGVLPTRLSSIDEAASMDVLCSDKTGTLTMNKLTVKSIVPMTGVNEAHVLTIAALACAEGSQDPVEIAIRAAACEEDRKWRTETRHVDAVRPSEEALRGFSCRRKRQKPEHCYGGFCDHRRLGKPNSEATKGNDDLQGQGLRVLAVAQGTTDQNFNLIGLIGLSDPPRPDAADLIHELETLGVHTVMVTGDAAATAATSRRPSDSTGGLSRRKNS